MSSLQLHVFRQAFALVTSREEPTWLIRQFHFMLNNFHHPVGYHFSNISKAIKDMLGGFDLKSQVG